MTYTPGGPQHILYKKAPAFTVVLRCNDKTMRFIHHKGLEDPELEEVINFLLVRSAAMGLTYQQYCKEFDYYACSKIKRMYYLDRRLGKKIKNFLGDDYEL